MTCPLEELLLRKSTFITDNCADFRPARPKMVACDILIGAEKLRKLVYIWQKKY